MTLTYICYGSRKQRSTTDQEPWLNRLTSRQLETKLGSIWVSRSLALMLIEIKFSRNWVDPRFFTVWPLNQSLHMLNDVDSLWLISQWNTGYVATCESIWSRLNAFTVAMLTQSFFAFVSFRPQYFGKTCKGSSRGHFKLCNTQVSQVDFTWSTSIASSTYYHFSSMCFLKR